MAPCTAGGCFRRQDRPDEQVEDRDVTAACGGCRAVVTLDAARVVLAGRGVCYLCPGCDARLMTVCPVPGEPHCMGYRTHQDTRVWVRTGV